MKTLLKSAKHHETLEHSPFDAAILTLDAAIPAVWSKLLKCQGGAGVEGAILRYVGRLQLISTLNVGADCWQLCQYKLTKPNLTYPNPEE